MKSNLAILFLAFVATNCGQLCGCGPPPIAIFHFYYKSTANEDLLNPQIGLYNPNSVNVNEFIEVNGKMNKSTPAANGGLYKNVKLNDTDKYFVNYYSSSPVNRNNLKMTLIELNINDTDTLTFENKDLNKLYPTEFFTTGNLFGNRIPQPKSQS